LLLIALILQDGNPHWQKSIINFWSHIRTENLFFHHFIFCLLEFFQSRNLVAVGESVYSLKIKFCIFNEVVTEQFQQQQAVIDYVILK